MRPLKEILLEMRNKRICKPIDDDMPEAACGGDRTSCKEGSRCEGWFQAEFAGFAGVRVRTYQRWEKGASFQPKNLDRLLKQLRLRPCKQRKADKKLEDWEEALFEELERAIELGPAPREIRPSIGSNLLNELRKIEKKGLATTKRQKNDLKDTIRFIESPEQRQFTSMVCCVSSTISLFEEQLRDLECEAESLLKFSSVAKLRSAAQKALDARKHPSDDKLNSSIDNLLRQAADEARGVLASRGEALMEADKEHLNRAVGRFTDTIDETTDIPFGMISHLCDEVFRLGAQQQRPDYFREILEILGDRAARAEAATLFADPDGPEMIVMPLPDSVEIGTSDQEIFVGNLVHPIPRREQPVVKAQMNKKFAISRFPVTVGEYRAFCDEKGRRLPDENKIEEGYKPVVGVSWHAARAYCDWLSQRVALSLTVSPLRQYRLPSEVEWEFACRTIEYADSPFYFGDYISTGDAVFEESEAQGVVATTTRRFAPNGYGLFFMHGNVWEWCEDSFQEGYDRHRTQEPIVCDPSVSKVLRGGSWGDPAHMLRSASRMDAPANSSSDLVGFRVACDL